LRRCFCRSRALQNRPCNSAVPVTHVIGHSDRPDMGARHRSRATGRMGACWISSSVTVAARDASPG
jgi:hypothetical protein